MKKALIIATVGRFYNFLNSDISILQQHGYEVHCATNMMLDTCDSMGEYNVKKHQINFTRTPFSKGNFQAYRQLKSLMELENFDIVHCHTPMGALLGRLAAKKYRKSGTEVLYTAHGLHFYKGASIKNWMIYFPVEWFSAFWTDKLITINREDYERAKKCLHAKNVYYLPSIGVDTDRYDNLIVDENKKRTELGLSFNDLVIVSVGELSNRKNHEVVIQALGELHVPGFKYLLIGEGDSKEQLEVCAEKMGISDNVYFLGRRNDVGEILKVADLFILPSIQEGVSMALLEAIACDVPVICSNIRGTVDVIKDKQLLFDPKDVKRLKRILKAVCIYSAGDVEHMDRKKLKNCMNKYVIKHKENLKAFDIHRVAGQMEKIYFET